MRYKENQLEFLPYLLIGGGAAYLGYEFIVKPMIEGTPEETIKMLEETAPIVGKPKQTVPGIPTTSIISREIPLELPSVTLVDAKNTAFAYKRNIAIGVTDYLRISGIPANITSTSMLYVVVERQDRDSSINYLRNIGIDETALKVPVRVPKGFTAVGFSDPAFAARFWTDAETDEAIRQLEGIAIKVGKNRVGMHYISVSGADAKNVWTILNATKLYEPKTGLIYES